MHSSDQVKIYFPIAIDVVNKYNSALNCFLQQEKNYFRKVVSKKAYQLKNPEYDILRTW